MFDQAFTSLSTSQSRVTPEKHHPRYFTIPGPKERIRCHRVNHCIDLVSADCLTHIMTFITGDDDDPVGPYCPLPVGGVGTCHKRARSEVDGG